MTTDDALKHLQAGLDRDERIARAATKLPQPVTKYPAKRPPWEPERWESDRIGDLLSVNGKNPLLYGDSVGDASARDADTAAHIANWDPKRAIEQAAVFREIAEALTAAIQARDSEDPHAYNAFTAGERAAAVMWLDWVVERLASAYAETGEPR